MSSAPPVSLSCTHFVYLLVWWKHLFCDIKWSFMPQCRVLISLVGGRWCCSGNFSFFFNSPGKKRKRDSCFFNPYKCQKTEKQTWIPFALACVAVCHADCGISTDMYTRAKWKKQLSKLKIWNGEKWESRFLQRSPVGPLSLLKANFNGSKYTLFWILSLQRMWFYPPSRTPAT